MAGRSDATPGSSVAFGAFEPLLQLGRGGMGTAILARATGPMGFERLVVLKRLHKHLLDRPESVRRFLDEAKVAALIRHANVVATHMVGSDDDGHFLVLDYVEGASLEELSDRAALKGDRLPAPIVLRVLLDALAGLHAVHVAEDTKGQPLHVLHRDISAQNVLVGRDGVSRIADFGVAKSRLGSVETDQRYIVGKLLYLPPEYLRREPVGPAFDIYSLGVTAWCALTGRDPWPGADEATLVTQLLTEGFPLLSSQPDVAPQVAAIIDRACDPNQQTRYQSAREMSEAIEQLGRETGWVASHHEVADLVSSLAGEDLQRVRDTIARRLEGGVKSDEREPAVTAEALQLTKPVHSATVETAVAAAIPGLPDRKRTQRSALIVFGLLLFAGIGFALVRGTTADAPAPAREATSAPKSVSTPATNAPAVESSATPPPLEPTLTAAASAQTSRPAPAVAPRPAPSPAPKAKPTTAPSPAGKPPAGISTSNPYRR